MGIFDKIKKFGEQLEKKIENADDSIKKFDENLKMDALEEPVEKTGTEELKELAKLKDDGILTEDEFQKKKEEILFPDSTTSKIEEENTSDKVVCDICKGEEWDSGDKGSDQLYKGYEVIDFFLDEHELEEQVALWCGMCMDTYMAKGSAGGGFEAEYYDVEDGETVIIGTEDSFNEGFYPSIVDAIREWKGTK